MERSTPWSNGALKLGVRPFGLHAARHTYASLALASGKSVCWTADPLGQASPMLTLKTYAHAMKQEEANLSFADFASPGRPDTAPRRILRASGSAKMEIPAQDIGAPCTRTSIP